jgi:hypothetical protein
MSESIFGPIFDGSVLTRAAIATLKTWFPTYIKEIEIQRGYRTGEIPKPKTYAERWAFDSYPDDKMPAVIVVSPGMSDPPRRDGDGTASGWWILGVGIIAAASTEDNSERLAKIYGAGARTILEQKGWLDESWEFNGCIVMDESYTEVPDIEQARTMRSVLITSRVQVLNMWNRQGGPLATLPPSDSMPGSVWPEVEEVFVKVKKI